MLAWASPEWSAPSQHRASHQHPVTLYQQPHSSGKLGFESFFCKCGSTAPPLEVEQWRPPLAPTEPDWLQSINTHSDANLCLSRNLQDKLIDLHYKQTERASAVTLAQPLNPKILNLDLNSHFRGRDEMWWITSAVDHPHCAAQILNPSTWLYRSAALKVFQQKRKTQQIVDIEHYE